MKVKKGDGPSKNTTTFHYLLSSGFGPAEQKQINVCNLKYRSVDRLDGVSNGTEPI
jgi:hypothetical protein